MREDHNGGVSAGRSSQFLARAPMGKPTRRAYRSLAHALREHPALLQVKFEYPYGMLRGVLPAAPRLASGQDRVHALPVRERLTEFRDREGYGLAQKIRLVYPTQNRRQKAVAFLQRQWAEPIIIGRLRKHRRRIATALVIIALLDITGDIIAYRRLFVIRPTELHQWV